MGLAHENPFSLKGSFVLKNQGLDSELEKPNSLPRRVQVSHLRIIEPRPEELIDVAA